MVDGLEARDKACEYALEEYKALWDYYKKTLEEREITLSYYFRTVTVPSAVLAVFLYSRLRNPFWDAGSHVGAPVDSAAVVPILIVIFLVGVACLFKYRLEAENARDYIRAINKIRAFFVSELPAVGSHLHFAQQFRPLPFLLSIPFYGGAVVALINSAILTSCSQILWPTQIRYLAATYVLVTILQLLAAEGLAYLRKERQLSTTVRR